MLIDAKKLDEAFKDSLFREDELPQRLGEEAPKDAVIVEGITIKVGFHPGRLESHREQVKAWLLALPSGFQKGSGDGWSFLNACVDRNGEQWGQHENIQQLLLMGIGLKLASYMLPREFWSLMPGGMPPFCVTADPA